MCSMYKDRQLLRQCFKIGNRVFRQFSALCDIFGTVRLYAKLQFLGGCRRRRAIFYPPAQYFIRLRNILSACGIFYPPPEKFIRHGNNLSAIPTGFSCSMLIDRRLVSMYKGMETSVC